MKSLYKILIVAFSLMPLACMTTDNGLGPATMVVPMEVTAYCPCKKCCVWKRNWLGRPVFASGSLKGERKKVGQTASGTQADIGTIAADTTLYPFGTVMYVPGYGYGRVEDRGGAIKGQRLDVFFKKHRQAEHWGRATVDVYIWLPGGTTQTIARSAN
jgi:3D (Asp-Asp-Asp) domain-containing protein